MFQIMNFYIEIIKMYGENPVLGWTIYYIQLLCTVPSDKFKTCLRL